jgi:hypothetical protein
MKPLNDVYRICAGQWRRTVFLLPGENPRHFQSLYPPCTPRVRMRQNYLKFTSPRSSAKVGFLPEYALRGYGRQLTPDFSQEGIWKSRSDPEAPDHVSTLIILLRSLLLRVFRLKHTRKSRYRVSTYWSQALAMWVIAATLWSKRYVGSGGANDPIYYSYKNDRRTSRTML